MPGEHASFTETEQAKLVVLRDLAAPGDVLRERALVVILRVLPDQVRLHVEEPGMATADDLDRRRIDGDEDAAVEALLTDWGLDTADVQVWHWRDELAVNTMAFERSDRRVACVTWRADIVEGLGREDDAERWPVPAWVTGPPVTWADGPAGRDDLEPRVEQWTGWSEVIMVGEEVAAVADRDLWPGCYYITVTERASGEP